MANDSQDVGKGIKDGLVGAGKNALRAKRSAKMAKAGLKLAAKLLKFFIQKIVLVILKSLGTVLLPYLLIIFTVIILLLLIVDSIDVFDIFQKGGERNQVEQLYDETVLEVLKARNDESPNDIRDTLRGTQEYPLPPVSESWLYQAGEYMKVSYAVPSILHYYKNLKNDNYKPHHKKYTNDDISTADKKKKIKEKFVKNITNEYDYLFDDETYTPKYEWSTTPKEEYKEIKTIKRCLKPIPSGTTGGIIGGIPKEDEPREYGPPSESIKKEALPSREIVVGVSSMYNKATIPYKDLQTDWGASTTTSSGECEITTSERFFLYVIDEGQPIQVELSATTLVSYLSVDAPEGLYSELVKPVDIEYALELGGEVDPAFPTLTMDFAKFIKCTKDKDITSCIGEHVLGGMSGFGGTVGGSWYPSDYLKLYQEAGEKYGVDWWFIASIHGQETGFSSNPAATDPSKASRGPDGGVVGAVGHFQFMPLTWAGWGLAKDPQFETTPLGNLIGDLTIITQLDIISKYNGYGVDANGDGKASPWDIKDAAYTAAKYIKASGYVKDNEAAIKKAIRAYNHSDSYVSEVYARAMMFKTGPAGGTADIPIAEGTFTWPTTGRLTSGYGMRNIFSSNSFHYGLDFGAGGRVFKIPIVSVADGKVSRDQVMGTFGNVIFVKHNINGTPFETVYAHLESATVSIGDTVKKGQTVGYMGNTGRSTSKHLHFEIHTPSFINQKTSSLNPANYIPVPPLK